MAGKMLDVRVEVETTSDYLIAALPLFQSCSALTIP
jgi:hypothetical protein